LAATGSKDAAAGRRRGRLRRAVNDLTGLLEVTRRIAEQTRQRMSGVNPPGATRRVSLHDSDARPIAKGQLGKPVQFGYKAQVVDNDDGVVLDHTLHQGNPADAPQLAPAVERVSARTGRKPRTVT
jgi:IS5 family transposase